ncbi:hypothetical protein [Syntrophomonas wolfei]|uniref:Uncharacterized protein n=1 Tax=Syntrophomonas wolfei subsp. wolfei (strain DSM 2245B / Goettingen) TaxID=335541 RepID=Q0AWL7_SYNWW|nr:hypothetical protein [Syntrophomonas wolfei]ABI68887.1 hypothetical protein Swol_1585 [Syntrophomonas wolfei subsp. wolfei str. Goettingen G311]
MSKLKQFFLIFILLVLFIGGLNLSNQGINHLTLDNRGPVFACNYEQGSLNLQLLSQDYKVSPELVNYEWQLLRQTAKNQGQQAVQYLNKSWLIFKAIFL